eukprot:TRINITY_DN2938_c0_g1_i1.p1 TRINITY_DN2938_c0_g1~~TRINITY_DN2938_c0_g1_i1.p1  ORF type:complete len:907 (-),score=271.79 TRINITY_DN2938_c0_g1_i1:1136-3856(-)
MYRGLLARIGKSIKGEGSTPGNEKKEDSGALEESTPARTTEVNELKEEEEEEEKKTKKAEKQAQDEENTSSEEPSSNKSNGHASIQNTEETPNQKTEESSSKETLENDKVNKEEQRQSSWNETKESPAPSTSSSSSKLVLSFQKEESSNSPISNRPSKRCFENVDAGGGEEYTKQSRLVGDPSTPPPHSYGGGHQHNREEPYHWRRGGGPPFRSTHSPRGTHSWRPRHSYNSPLPNPPQGFSPARPRFHHPPPFRKEEQPLTQSPSSAELALEQVNPLSQTPYEKQLKLKEDEVLAFMARLKTDTLHANRALHAWYAFQEASNPSICRLRPMMPSPLLLGYQSCVEFSIGRDDSGRPAIGVPLPPESQVVGSIEKLKNVPKIVKLLVKSLEGYLAGSPYKPYDHSSKEGNWLSISVRYTTTEEVLLIVAFHPQGVEKLDIKGVRLGLQEHFASGRGPSLSSLIFNERTLEHKGTFEVLTGSETVTERICGQLFSVGPSIPFWGNSPGMEAVLQALVEAAGLNSETTLVDLCCGGGVIGLCLARHVGQVLGLDILEELVNESRRNALRNGLTNCEFFSGSGEHYLPVLLNRVNFSNIVLVVDPPEFPLDSKVMINIRKCSNIRRILWLVREPTAQRGNKSFEDLLRPPSNAYKGDPFIPVEVLPVDTAPHTFHFTMVIILMRVSMRELVSPREVNLDRFYANPKTLPPTNTKPSSSTPFSDYPPPDLSWKKVAPESSEQLSQEQLAWLNSMSATYKKEFDRASWEESLRRQNREATLAQTPKAFPYPPPTASVPPPNSASCTVPIRTNTPEYWAQYSKQYSSYMMSYSTQQASYAQPGVDPQAWKQYCEQMANYWATWAARGGGCSSSSGSSVAPPKSSMAPLPPLPATNKPPPPLPPPSNHLNRST